MAAATGMYSADGASARQPSGDEVPSYSERAGIEHHRQVSDFIPRRARTIWLGLAIALTGVAGLATLDHFRVDVARILRLPTATAFQLTSEGSLASWYASTLLLVAALGCVLIYSLRRHKLNDYRGRYRIWLSAAIGCGLLSVTTATALHRLFATSAARFSGWSPLEGDALWWLAVGGLAGGWIGLRMLVDVWESRLARVALCLALGCYGLAIVWQQGWLSPFDTRWDVHRGVAAAVALGGHVWLLTAITAYARYVILDVQGLVTPRRTETAAQPRQPKTTGEPPIDPRTGGSKRSGEGQSREPRREPATDERPPQKIREEHPQKSAAADWVDGSFPIDDDYEDDPRQSRKQKLSKSERKQLRKLKAQNRAA